jgi:hypothetical protein
VGASNAWYHRLKTSASSSFKTLARTWSLTRAKQLETISGPVEQVNAKGTGIKLLGEWLNVSQYHPVATMPTPGGLVECQIERTDRGAWISALKIIGGAPASSSSTTPNRDREIHRLTRRSLPAALMARSSAGLRVHSCRRGVRVYRLARP